MGYGDITLKSDWGRLIAILIIIVAIVFIPVEINKLLELASRRFLHGLLQIEIVFLIISHNN